MQNFKFFLSSTQLQIQQYKTKYRIISFPNKKCKGKNKLAMEEKKYRINNTQRYR